MGEAIARNAWPARIARDGTLHVAAADSVWAFELGNRAGEIAGRLGVTRIRFAPGPLPGAAVEPAQSPPQAVPTAESERLAAELTAPIGDERLREAARRTLGLALADRRPAERRSPPAPEPDARQSRTP